MRWVLKWTLIIFVGLFALHLIEGNKWPDTSTQQVAKPPVDVDKAFTYCLLPKAQYGQYSSYDGGKSAMSLLMKDCAAEGAAWIADCQQKTGADAQTCGINALTLAQAAIKNFNK